MDKIFRLYLLLTFFSSAGISAFADPPGQAPDDNPSVDTAVEAKASYLYDLKKLIQKSRENIKEVNQKIKEQSVLKRNQKREERARQYYEKGVALTNAGRFDEARDYFEKAIRITEHPEMAGYIKQSQQRFKKQESALQAQEREHYKQIKQDESARKQDVEAAYKEAVDLYQQKKYHPAKDAFEHVDEIVPDYRATASYLKIIDQNIIKADALAAKQQALEIARQQKEAEAARLKEKQTWLAEIEEKEKERKEAINKQARDVYDQAVELYKNKKFADAKKKFEEVSWVIPEYKATRKYLTRIDKDAREEQERAARQQQKALEEQRWEETVERKKQEALRQRELKAKELQKKQDLREQAQFLYTAGVNLFNKKSMDEALKQFNDIEKLFPNFKSTRVYIARIEQWKVDRQKRPIVVQAKEVRLSQGPKDKTDQAKRIYALASQSYRERHWEESRAQFRSVEQIIPGFKHTHRYLQKITDIIARQAKAGRAVIVPPAPAIVTPKAKPPAPVPAAIAAPLAPARIKPAVSLEDQQQQARDIAALAEKSAQLYRQIADISDDKYTAQTKRKIAEVDDILNNLKENKERLLRQRREEQDRILRKERAAEAQKSYQKGLEYFRARDYAKAKTGFLAVENLVPDYKGARRYLSRIEEYQKRANIEAAATREQKEEGLLKQLQDKENAGKQAALRDLAQKASAINDDIIRLSAGQDYEAMKAKFAELEKTVAALTALKETMAKQKGRQEREKQSARESIRRRDADQYKRREITREHKEHAAFIAGQLRAAQRELLLIQERERRRFHQVKAPVEQHPVISPAVVAPVPAALEARREAARKQWENGLEAMYKEALRSYQRGDYRAAADKFKDVQDLLPGYKRAGQYMKKARLKSLAVKPQAAVPPRTFEESVSKALDFFESNAP